jgi:uncharacterized protein (TIGR03032 family)
VKKAKYLFKQQQNSLRDPLEVVSASWQKAGIFPESLKYNVSDEFVQLLKKLNITLYVSREYENLLLSLNVTNNVFEQGCFPLPHPSGIAVNKENNSLYVASTRNPNQIIEFSPSDTLGKGRIIAFPSRIKFYSGSFYFHDLAIIKNQLYANSVGQNGIIQIDMNSPKTESLMWWPLCVEKKSGTPDISANHIQLNSIAAGGTFEKSFFTASGCSIGRRKPGHKNYPVNKTGVVISAKTREVIATGLSRPHSAKQYKGRIWLDNSSYGEFGYLEKNKFQVLQNLPGWTRGLCIIDNIAFVGVSRVLPRFADYAPGLKGLKKQRCGIVAVDLKSGYISGSIFWPYGNQIFGIESAKNHSTGVLLYSGINKIPESQKQFYFNYKI